MDQTQNGKFIQLLDIFFRDLSNGEIIESDLTFYSFLCGKCSSQKVVNKSIDSLCKEYIVADKPKSPRAIHNHLSRLIAAGHLQKNGSAITIKTFVKNKNEYVIKGKKFKRQ